MKKLTVLGLHLFLSSLTLLYIWLIFTHPFYQSDYRAFYSAAQILRAAPEKLYDFDTQNTYQSRLVPREATKAYRLHVPFANPPIFLLPFLSLTFFSPAAGYVVTLVVNMGLLIIALTWLTKLFPIARGTYWLVVLAALSFTQTYATILLSQSSIITLLIFIGVYVLLIHKQWLTVGLIGSLLLYKPQLGVVLYAYFLLKRQPKVILGLLLGTGLQLLLSHWLTQGHLRELLITWLNFVNQPGTSPLNRITWLGFFTQIQYFFPRFPAMLLAVVATLATLAIAFKSIGRFSTRAHFPLVYSLIIITTLLAGWHVHAQETMLLFFPLFYASHQFSWSKIWPLAIGTWLTFFLYTWSPFYPYPIFFLPTLVISLIWLSILRVIASVEIFP